MCIFMSENLCLCVQKRFLSFCIPPFLPYLCMQIEQFMRMYSDAELAKILDKDIFHRISEVHLTTSTWWLWEVALPSPPN